MIQLGFLFLIYSCSYIPDATLSLSPITGFLPPPLPFTSNCSSGSPARVSGALEGKGEVVSPVRDASDVLSVRMCSVTGHVLNVS